MKIRFFNEADEWTTDGAKITDPEHLETIRRTLENDGPVLVEHWFYRSASAPDRVIFDDFNQFTEYLNSRASAGDIINVWSFSAMCTDQNWIASGKCPDDQDRVPKKGAY
jgi:hypothetical protein